MNQEEVYVYDDLEQIPIGLSDAPMTDFQNIAAYGVTMDDEFVQPVSFASYARREVPFNVKWSNDHIPNPHHQHYPNNATDPMLRASTGAVDFQTIDLVISRNSMRKLFSCFQPFSHKFTKSFSICVELVKNRLLVIRSRNPSPVPAGEVAQGGDNDWGPGMFGMSFEEMLTASVDNFDGFGYNILSFSLGSLKVLSSNEIDCVEDDSFIELKSVKQQVSFKDEYHLDMARNNRREMMRNTYTQMMLSNTHILAMGEIEYPESLENGATGVVRTLSRINVGETLEASRIVGNGIRAEPRFWRYKVECLLLWIRKQMADSAISVNGRKIVHLNYTCMVPAKPAVKFRAANRYKVGQPERQAAPAVAEVSASLELRIIPWQQQESTISADVYDAYFATLQEELHAH